METKIKNKGGFSLVELMVVIAIIAILAAIAIPMYSNYTTRANITNEISQLGGAKVEISQQIANLGFNSGDTISGINSNTIDLAAGVTVQSNGQIQVSSTALSGATIRLTPSMSSGTVAWSCDVTGTNVTSSKLPSTCTVG